MQEWGYLSDWASKEKISFSTISCESDRRERREGSVTMGGGLERREGKNDSSAHGRYKDIKLKSTHLMFFQFFAVFLDGESVETIKLVKINASNYLFYFSK